MKTLEKFLVALATTLVIYGAGGALGTSPYSPGAPVSISPLVHPYAFCVSLGLGLFAWILVSALLKVE